MTVTLRVLGFILFLFLFLVIVIIVLNQIYISVCAHCVLEQEVLDSKVIMGIIDSKVIMGITSRHLNASKC